MRRATSGLRADVQVHLPDELTRVVRSGAQMTAWDLEALGLGTASVMVVALTVWAIASGVAALRMRPRR